MHRRPVTFWGMPFQGRSSFCICWHFRAEKITQSESKSFKYPANSIPNEFWNSCWGHLGPSCTYPPQKLQVEVQCVGPESLETVIRSTQNNHSDIMHIENHAFCPYIYPETWKLFSVLGVKGDKKSIQNRSQIDYLLYQVSEVIFNAF